MNRVVMVNKVSSLLFALTRQYIIAHYCTFKQHDKKNYGEAHINDTHVTKQKFLLKPSATN